jgi:hypothetical protein
MDPNSAIFQNFGVFLNFLSKCGPKSQYFWQFFQMRPRDLVGLATLGLNFDFLQKGFHNLLDYFTKEKWLEISSKFPLVILSSK